MGDFKDKHGKTRLGTFIQKAGKVFPDILDAGVKLASGNVLGAMEEIGNVLSSERDNPKNPLTAEAQQLLNEFELKKEQFALEAFKVEVEDRKDARNLYSNDSWIQKALALLFVSGYALLSWYLLEILVGSKEISKLGETMVTMIWTGTSVKLNTIVDFFFGGAMKN